MTTNTPSKVEVARRPRLPILAWLSGYQVAWLRFDILAGLTTAAVVIPQAMAYATIAGLPVQVGLYTALVPMLIYVLLGTSRPLSVSTTSTIAILTAAELAVVVPGAGPGDTLMAASALALLVGVFLLLASLLRLGFIANFISAPVLTGFKAGIGLVIFIGQSGKVLGFSVPKAGFFETIYLVFENSASYHLPTFLTALLTLGILLILPRILPRLSAPLVAVAAGIAASALFKLGDAGVALVGEIPAGLPALRFPDLATAGQLGLGALGIALMAFVESIASARAFAGHKDPPADADRELFALGAANLGGRPATSDAGGRRYLANCGEQSGRSAQPACGAGYSWIRGPDAALPGAADRLDAAGDAGRPSHGGSAWACQGGRVSSNSSHPSGRVLVGDHRTIWRSGTGHTGRDHDRGGCLSAGVDLRSQPPTTLHVGTKTRHRYFSPL
jgi:SulP family sulfate permease